MGFTTPCFIRKDTQELRRGLEELGYSKNYPEWTVDCSIIWAYQYPIKGFDTPNYVIADSFDVPYTSTYSYPQVSGWSVLHCR